MIDLVGLAGKDYGAASITEFHTDVISEPVVSERVALGLMTYGAGLGSIAICLNPAMTDLCDDLAVADDLITVKATDLSGMSLCHAGSTDSTLEGDVGMLAGSLGRRTAGINGDAVSTALRRKLGIGDRINGGGELKSNDIAITCQSRFCGCTRYPTVNVFRLKTYAVDLKPYYAGVCNNDVGALVATNGIRIICHITCGGGLVIGNGYTVLLPNLSRGSKLCSVCGVRETDSHHRCRDLFCSANRAFIVGIAVSVCGNLIVGIFIAAKSACKDGKSIDSTGGSYDYCGVAMIAGGVGRSSSALIAAGGITVTAIGFQVECRYRCSSCP